MNPNKELLRSLWVELLEFGFRVKGLGIRVQGFRILRWFVDLASGARS